MRNWIITIATLFVFAAALPASAGQAMQDGGHSTGSHVSESGHDMTGGMNSESGMAGMKGMKVFKHQAVVDGIQADFQVMSLASMNMSDPEGHTHHIMVKLSHEESGQPIADAIGKIKVIAPDKKEQTGLLKRYGDFMAANFTFDVPGKYGVICLFVVNGQKHVVKFWYPHQE
jgi:hypothetical protein